MEIYGGITKDLHVQSQVEIRLMLIANAQLSAARLPSALRNNADEYVAQVLLHRMEDNLARQSFASRGATRCTSKSN